MKYAYCRISKPTQNIERQVRDAITYDKDILIVKEVYTGRKVEGRTEFNKLLNKVKKGDTIWFDSVSRMSRDSEEGFKLYQELYNKGVELVFRNEPYINTEVYKQTLNRGIKMTNTDVDIILNAVNEYLMILAEQQIKLSFEQAEKEVKDLSDRTKRGLETARLNNKQIGTVKGTKLTTKKSIKCKELILKYNKDFGQGNLKDVEVIKLCGISRNTYYKYKKELIRELTN